MPSLKFSVSLLLLLPTLACTPAREPAEARSSARRAPLASARPAPATSATASQPKAQPQVSLPATGVVLAGATGCALLESRALDCWGGAHGEAPARIAGLGDVRAVALEPRMGMAVVLGSGRVRIVDTAGKARDLDKLGDAVGVSMSFPALCALRSDGKVACHRSGLWDEQQQSELAPDIVNNLSDAKQFEIGTDFGCAVRGDGKVWCFQHTVGAHQTPRATVVPKITDAVQVRVGASIACVLGRDRGTHCFSLGLVPRKTVELGSADALAVFQDNGNEMPLVCTADGLTVHCQRPEPFGDSYGVPSVSSNPVTITGSGPIRALAAINNAVCSVDARGAVACFGHNLGGVLGQPDARFVQAPVRVAGLEKIRSVSEGEGFSCALSKAKEVYCWGEAPESPSGGPEADPDASVKKLTEMPKVERLVASKGYACAFTKSGESHCFFGVEYAGRRARRVYRVPVLDSTRQLILPEMGFTNYAAAIDSTGQLLLGPSSGFDTIENLVLTPVPGFAKVRRIASSYWRLYVQDESGEVSRLDIHEGKVSGKPLRLPAFDGATSLGGYGYALLANGAVFEERDGTTTKLRESSSWVSLLDAAGPCGLANSGELSCWETDAKHERLLARDVKQASRTEFHGPQTCFVDSHARVSCLGDCSWGQCGAKVGILRSDTPLAVMLP